MSGGKGQLRGVELLRAGWGAALLVAPRHVLRPLRVDVDTASVVTARVLGARHLAQAALSGLRPSEDVLALGVWVDVVHSLTAVGLAVADPARSWAAGTDAVVAGTWAALGERDLKHPSNPPVTDQRWRDAAARWVLAHVPLGSRLLRSGSSRRQPGGSGPLLHALP
jgi:hypothetical protein